MFLLFAFAVVLGKGDGNGQGECAVTGKLIVGGN